MKKLGIVSLMALVTMMSAMLVSCEDDHYWDDYYFDLDGALDAYFHEYGDFGTDDRTTAKWFDYHFANASDRDYRDFLKAIDYERYENQKLMAKYLNGYWIGDMVMRYRDNNGMIQKTPCSVAWDFELSSTSDISGRGLETRVIAGEGTMETPFSWLVNEMGDIELSFDAADAGSAPVNMLVAYSDLDVLSSTNFRGTATGVNIDEEDDFDLVKESYAKPFFDTRSASVKTFGGKNIRTSSAPVVRNITKVGRR